jgi:hypothetical protein
MKARIYPSQIVLGLFSAAVLICSNIACRGLRPPSTVEPSATPDSGKVVDNILAKYTDAVGGQAAIEQVKTFSGKGTFSMSVFAVSGTYEVWGKDPNKTLSVIKFPNGIVIKKGFDGETRWVETPFGTTTEGPAEMSEIEKDADIYSAGRIKSLYESMRLEQKARLKGHDVDVVEGIPKKGPSEKLYFDSDSGLLLRWDMVRRHPQRGNIFVKVHLDDYRDVGGTKEPFNVRFAFESFDLTIKIDELKHNIPLDDAMFRKPH